MAQISTSTHIKIRMHRFTPSYILSSSDSIGTVQLHFQLQLRGQSVHQLEMEGKCDVIRNMAIHTEISSKI